ncbi:MAG: HAD-IIIA family hydrolase [Gammaproteobacteria bacterium]|nr:HAD-IIIA family hydrolase [Gammaproteobacteria bacterium]
MTALQEQLKKIKLLILDVDGVLTDGKIYMTAHGEETIAFFVRDGLGIEMLHAIGISVAVISGRNTPAVLHRLKKLRVQHIYLGHLDKIASYENLLSTLKISPDEVAYVGDDLPDIAVMEKVGLSFAVANAMDAVKKAAMHCTEKKGGKGAVREVCDLIYNAKKR